VDWKADIRFQGKKEIYGHHEKRLGHHWRNGSLHPSQLGSLPGWPFGDQRRHLSSSEAFYPADARWLISLSFLLGHVLHESGAHLRWACRLGERQRRWPHRRIEWMGLRPQFEFRARSRLYFPAAVSSFHDRGPRQGFAGWWELAGHGLWRPQEGIPLLDDQADHAQQAQPSLWAWDPNQGTASFLLPLRGKRTA